MDRPCPTRQLTCSQYSTARQPSQPARQRQPPQEGRPEDASMIIRFVHFTWWLGGRPRRRGPEDSRRIPARTKEEPCPSGEEISGGIAFLPSGTRLPMRVGPERVVRNNKDGQFRRVVRDEYWGLVVILAPMFFLGGGGPAHHSPRGQEGIGSHPPAKGARGETAPECLQRALSKLGWEGSISSGIGRVAARICKKSALTDRPSSNLRQPAHKWQSGSQQARRQPLGPSRVSVIPMAPSS